MPKISQILQQPEDRKLEFKREITSGTAIAKTAIAFTNDAGIPGLTIQVINRNKTSGKIWQRACKNTYTEY